MAASCLPSSDSTKPCITQPQELARASLIPLPLVPPGMRNGVYWFTWSGEQWTVGVRTQHNDADWCSRYMQKFDVDAWLISRTGQQALPISQLSSLV